MPAPDVIERALRGDASREELDSIAAWRRDSLENEREYRRLERLIRVAASMRAELRTVTPPDAAQLLARAEIVEARERGGKPAAQRERMGRRWRIAMMSGAAAAALVAATATGRVSAGDRDALLAPTEIITGPSELATVQLGDGSVVRLAPSSRLRVRGKGAERDVELEGRAFFAIARDEDHPFLVHTSAGVARVLGTRFELTTDGEALELTVVEGRVALDAPANSVEVVQGQRSHVTERRASAPQRITDATHTLDWVGSFLAFQSTPLDEAMREVERIYGVQVAITDSGLARQTVTATFTSQRVESVVSVLCTVVSARCTTVGDTLRVSR
jgi:transmembrane sensor